MLRALVDQYVDHDVKHVSMTYGHWKLETLLWCAMGVNIYSPVLNPVSYDGARLYKAPIIYMSCR